MFDEVVDRHRDDAEHGARADDGASQERTDGEAYQSVLRGPPPAIRQHAHEKEEARSDARDRDDGEQRERSLYA